MQVINNDRVIVCDFYYHRVLLLNEWMQEERVILDNSSEVKPYMPLAVHYDQTTKRLYVAHYNASKWDPRYQFISAWYLP